MPYEVKMPQLGMTQDSGVIVSWLKKSGDAVAEGDVLFEVETDKATMEVEAAAKGYLSGIRAAEGDDVPVGDVIALIVATESEVDEGTPPTVTETKLDTAAAPQPDKTPEPDKAPEPAPAPPPSATPQAPPAGKVLASPLAKRLASEQGIDLAALRAQGIAEPIHAADLSRASTGGNSVLSAKVSGAALNALLDRSEDADRALLLAAFAAGAWRASFAVDTIGVALSRRGAPATMHADPDRGDGAAETATFALIDLCDTRLSGYACANGGITLTAARQGDSYNLTLSFAEAALPLPQAIAFLDETAARIEDPIRQLL